MFNFMHPVTVFSRKPVAELAVRQAVGQQAAQQSTNAQWRLSQSPTGGWSAHAPHPDAVQARRAS